MGRYLISFGHRFNWHPRQVDQLRLSEFDAYAHQIDQWDAEEERQAREAKTAKGR